LKPRLECVVLIGLPASGKSTFYRERLASTHVHISKDNFPNARNRSQHQRDLIERALAAGQSVAIDNTNPTIEDRAAIIAQARSHGAQIVGYYFDTATRDCVARNRGREGRARVPPVAIFTVAKRLQRPSLDEGFDRLHTVRVIENGGFDVTSYPAPES
jgi:predicted kinase